MIRYIILAILSLSQTALVAQTATRASVTVEDPKDTVNVERYDDTNLKPLVSSLETVPWFHQAKDRFWYTWHKVGEKSESEYYIWERGKGKRKVTREIADSLVAGRLPRLTPYGTSTDSVWRLSVDSLRDLVLENLKTGSKAILFHGIDDDFPFEIIDVNGCRAQSSYCRV